MAYASQQFDRQTREAIQQLEAKRDRNTGGILLGKRMVHKNERAYNRKSLRLADKREICHTW